MPRRKRTAIDGVERGDYTPDELEFLRAIDHYKREKRRPYPEWWEVLEVIKSLGYRKP